MASKVELELQKATGIKPKAKEKVQDYLKRLHGATSELDDDAWKGLSTPAQKWANDATKAFDADKPLPEFEAAEEEEAAPAKGKAKAKPAAAEAEEEDDASAADAEDETNADEPEGEGEEDKTVSTKTKKKAAPAAKAPAKKAAAKDEAPAKKKASTPAKSQGGVQAVLNHVLKRPDDSVADIVAALKKDGITVTTSTVSSARGFFKLVVRFLQSKKLTTKVIFED